MYHFRIFTLFIVLFLLSSCEDDTGSIVHSFIGDSEIARWDLQYYFPHLITENHGKGGSGVAYIEEMAGTMSNRVVIVQFGTNDIKYFDSDYPARYVKAVSDLQSKDVYVISMFPRDFKGDLEIYNDLLLKMNNEIKILVSQKGWQYLDVFPLLEKDGTINNEYYTDGLHLSPKGYELISSELRKVMK